MEGRTYRYFKGKPLYAFGHGLSYTTYHYSNLRLPASVEKGKPVVVQVRVTNGGKMDGEEVVQLYVGDKAGNQKTPVRSLKGFKRVF